MSPLSVRAAREDSVLDALAVWLATAGLASLCAYAIVMWGST